ncbi:MULTISPECIES: TRAP transporter small permease [Brevibacillus]|jgi:C4-dicarboxylate transporter DctQ subunit|uniref:TRAP dicarboxylate transporter subunit DctQ n=1 Tax=Brevibacillus borstelensis AK1 TaxID=1300222 RepID=M8DI21_9BACL|nr:TRAP transporter small permease [Brevibacillus borstelensis]EMT53198.1 TRAP dicarboxylate transporter subunit DctQ [Brevibacillus borstelensis AK1]KKX55415.1 TRAP dicarboxylate transporter subunit DctQ [Brevibacillus borstelensis cifa_chp40]MBE5397623.1 TRAP transporter small permease [Brevibacillus borstelensis]MCC0563620.1 TRAP transporter small permease [Brevibacillus borstelensis]MCM3469263.1 TRAP transporter small permease [Brevibacillus borstelensis]
MSKWRERYATFEDYLAGTLIVIGVSLIFYGVVCRYVFNSPKAWIDEISTYFVVWGALTGFAVALRDGHHIQVDIVYDRVSPALRKAFDVFSNALGALFCLCFIFFGGKLLSLYWVTQQQSTDVGIYLWIVYLVIPLSGLMLGYRFVEKLLASLKKEVKIEWNG